MSILIFLAVLGVLVLVHEWGHFIVAKKSGMRVDEFAIGFPPKLFGIRRGETEYTLNLIPIGGFVKIYGEDAEASQENAEYARSFSAQNKWKQSAVLLAGVIMNVLFAWFLFSLAFATGIQTSVTEAEAGPTAKLMITGVMPDGPAADAVFTSGMTIVGAYATGSTLAALTPSEFSTFISAHKDIPVTIAYTVDTVLREIVVVPKAGVIADDPERAALGVSLALIETIKKPILTAIADGFTHTMRSTRDIAVGLYGLVRDAVQFKADLSSVAGPIGIVGLVGEASAFGFTTLLMFTAFISLNLAVINILPFPALDGGRLLLVLIEAAKGSPINSRFTQVLNATGFILLILLMVAVTWNDIARLM